MCLCAIGRRHRPALHTIRHFSSRNSQVEDLRGRPGPVLSSRQGAAAPPPPGCDSMKVVMSPSLYLIVVPLIRRNGQPMFNRLSYCSTFTLHPRMAAYTCSSTHAQGTGGTCVRSTTRGALLISQQLLQAAFHDQSGRQPVANFDIDEAVAQARQSFEEVVKLLLEREIGLRTLAVPLGLGIQFDCLNNPRRRF